MTQRQLFWKILGCTLLCALAPACIILTKDYQRTVQLRYEIEELPIGSTEEEILARLGKPDAVWTHPDSSAVWVYCSKFDWDGCRSRWIDQSFLEYWNSRLSPSVDTEHDDVVQIHLRGGILERISHPEDVIGYHPTISF